MNKFIIAAMFAALVPTSANALVIDNDNGGNLHKRQMMIKALKEKGEKVIITGQCLSSCTWILLLPHGQVCATEKAKLGFHALMTAAAPGSDKPKIVNGKRVMSPPEIQNQFINTFPSNVIEWIIESKALNSTDITLVPATKFIPLCDPSKEKHYNGPNDKR